MNSFVIEIQSNASNLLAGAVLSGWAIRKTSLYALLIIAGMSGIVIVKATSFLQLPSRLIVRGSCICEFLCQKVLIANTNQYSFHLCTCYGPCAQFELYSGLFMNHDHEIYFNNMKFSLSNRWMSIMNGIYQIFFL